MVGAFAQMSPEGGLFGSFFTFYRPEYLLLLTAFIQKNREEFRCAATKAIDTYATILTTARPKSSKP